MTTTEIPRMLTVEEVAKALGGISTRQVQRLARAKKIPGAVWLGRKLVFRRAPVIKFIEESGAV